MVLGSTTASPVWLPSQPSAFDIVSCFYPEGPSSPYHPGPTLRPALVLAVAENKRVPGQFAVKVAYGTKNLKLARRPLDLIIQNAADLAQMGLPQATRFDLDLTRPLAWQDSFFGCWGNNSTPRMGALLEKYVMDYAYLMAQRSVKKP